MKTQFGATHHVQELFGFVVLARSGRNRQRYATRIGQDVQLRSITTLGSSECVIVRLFAFAIRRSGCTAMSSYDTAVNAPQRTINATTLVDPPQQRVHDSVPQSFSTPPAKASIHCRPATVLHWQVAPTATYMQYPKDSIDHSSMIVPGATCPTITFRR